MQTDKELFWQRDANAKIADAARRDAGSDPNSNNAGVTLQAIQQ